MAELIRMPKMSDTMEEGVIAAWNVKVGDQVKSGDILAEVETDKATMDMESFEDGTVLHIGVKKGDAVPVNAVMMVIGKPGESFEELLAEEGDGGGSSSTDKEEETVEPSSTSEDKDSEKSGSSEKIDTSKIKATLIKMPLLSDTMTEGVIHNWAVKVGDKISSGDVLAEIETDKATMEIESYDDGEILHIGVEAGEAAAVNAVIAVIGEKGADYEALIKADGQKDKKKIETPAAPAAHKAHADHSAKPAAASPEKKPTETPKASSNGRLLASPLAKRLAEEKGVDIAQIAGSGEGGRIIKVDVDNFVPSAVPQAASSSQTPNIAIPAGEESFEEIPLSQMRKAIARGVVHAKSTAPEFYLTIEVCMDNVVPARVSMNDYSPVKITFNDIVIKACAVALAKHPAVNSSWKETHIRRNHHVHVAMAVAVEDGLLMPVIKFANTLSLSQVASETKRLGALAKNKELQPKHWEGNTFTVSNLGAFGIDEFTSILNGPSNEACILAVGGIKDTVGVKPNGEFYATKIMKVTLTCDHRVVDGATGAAFLVTLKDLLEDPYKLLV